MRHDTLWLALVVIGLVSVSLLCRGAYATAYRAPVGSLKDNCVVWHDGTYYLFTMYRQEQQIDDVLEQWRHVWLATSTDGVHWEDVGPVIKDAPFIIFAMRVWRVGDRWIMNHGSFTGGSQDVLKLWESPDLRNWTYMGPEYDVRRPDGQRIDHMDVVPVEEDGKTVYYGYAVGGLLRSEDGVKWTWLSDFDLTDNMDVRVVAEPGGCNRIGDTYYLLMGGFFPGNFGYCVTTFTSKDPKGPFAPDYPAYRLTGNSGRNLVALWAGYCKKPDDLLLINYILDPGGLFWWHAPMKRAVVDAGGHLRMGYWEGNDAMKGQALALDTAGAQWLGPNADGVSSPGPDSVTINAPPRPLVRWITAGEPNTALAVMDRRFNVDKGIVIEGTMQIAAGNALVFPAIGLYFDEGDQTGKAVVFGAWGETLIGTLDWSGQPRLDVEDRVGFGCATVAGIADRAVCPFRVLFRKNVFEVYLNDLLVQTYSTTSATGRIGFFVQDGVGTFGDLKVWDTTLD